jgi:phosphatidylcholine synthase
LPEQATKQKILIACAWGVHLYTALGAAMGLLALHYAAINDFRGSFIAMGVAVAIDSSDGTLARLVDVKARAPGLDGSLLDNIVDYLTYVVAPAFLMLQAGIVPAGAAGLAVACFVIVASAYQFCQAEAKTADNYFRGFPSYWNLVAFYLYCLRLPIAVNLLVLLAFGVMVFIPIKYIHPSRTRPLRPLTVTLGIVWAVVTIAMLPGLPQYNPVLLCVSLAYVAYYMLVSFALNAWSVLARGGQMAEP